MRNIKLLTLAIISLIIASCGTNNSENGENNNKTASHSTDTLAIIKKINKQVATILKYTEAGEARIVDTGKEDEYHEKLLNSYYYNADNNVIRIMSGAEGGSDFYVSGGKLIYIDQETEAGTEIYYFIGEKLFCQMNDYIGDGTMKPLPGNNEIETAKFNAFKEVMKLEKSSRSSYNEEITGDIMDETLILTENQLMPKGNYDVTDFDFERFGDFTDKKILSQLWTKGYEQYLKKGKVSVYLYPDRLSKFEEIVLYVSLNNTKGEVRSLWYVIYDKNKNVTDYACLSQYKQENKSLKNGKFTSKTEFFGKWKSNETGATEDFGLTLLDDGRIAEEIEGVDAEEYEEESEEISLYPETYKKFEVAGIDDDKAVYEFIQNLKNCGSRDELMKHIDFPIMLNGKGTEKSEFPKDCDKILSYLALMSFDENSASSRGVMVGSGEIYINSIEKKLKITTINIE